LYYYTGDGHHDGRGMVNLTRNASFEDEALWVPRR
jgi:hypothetical protein